MTHERWKIAFHFSQEKFIKLTKVIQKWGNLVDKQRSWRQLQSKQQIFSHTREYGRCTLKALPQLSRGGGCGSTPQTHTGCPLQTSGSKDSEFALFPAATSPSHAPQPALDLWSAHPASMCWHWGGRKTPYQSMLSSLLCALTALLHDGPGALICVCRAAIPTGDFLNYTIRSGC